jgi:hypothetical protein
MQTKCLPSIINESEMYPSLLLACLKSDAPDKNFVDVFYVFLANVVLRVKDITTITFTPMSPCKVRSYYTCLYLYLGWLDLPNSQTNFHGLSSSGAILPIILESFCENVNFRTATYRSVGSCGVNLYL